MLIDEAYIILSGGKGGAGNVSFFPGLKSGPSGGDGGQGGNVFVRVNKNLTTLHKYTEKTKYEASKGENGGGATKTGAHGMDLILDFPIGTELREQSTGKIVLIPSNGEMIMVCQGGLGGHGNDFYKSPTNRSPRQAGKGQPGEVRTFKAVMRLIADIGFIGLPNAGKSSLLNELTAATARVAPYPFTTIEPNLGALGDIVLADIPGLIEGASKGRGLGIRFLKHVEKVKLLIHCVACDREMSIMEKEYVTVREELGAYNPELLKKPELLLLTKSDLILPKDRLQKLKSFRKINPSIFCVSVYDVDALEELKKILNSYQKPYTQEGEGKDGNE